MKIMWIPKTQSSLFYTMQKFPITLSILGQNISQAVFLETFSLCVYFKVKH